MEVAIIYIRIETSSSVPIYRQIIDQIKYQIAVGTLKAGARMPGVRELGARLAVNQNTILKVYNQLCQEKILEVDRGNGTFVSSATSSMTAAERKQIVAKLLNQAVVQAVHLNIELKQLHDLLDREHQTIQRDILRRSDDE
jgi:GntR family transcriptional regulator